MGDEIPSRIGKYDVDGIVGHGGMGIVYRGHDALGRQVAIKMVLASFLGESELIKRFQREAQFTANLHHPNIVTVYDWGQEGSSPFVVMEFLIGRSLDRWQFDGPPPMLLLKKLNIIEQVCAGLNYAHERKIVHRDIKPPNIFVLDDESVKLVDFGVARLTEGAGHGMTRTGQIIGSLYYMSPEQANGFKLDHRTDIFSAGVVLYELLSGVLPFAGRDTASTLIRILTASPQPLSELMGSCPPELEEVVLRALEKAPRDRYQTAEELALDLSQVQMQLRRQIGGEYLASAEAAMQRSDWLKAKEVLVELLKLDREHVRGLDMLREVQQIIRRQDRVSEAAGFKRQAEDAFEKRRFKDALELAEEAVSLDNSNYDLVVFRDEIRATLNRSEKARLAMDRAETSFHAQRLEAAQGAIDEALSLDPLNTSAQQLQGKIANALAEQFKRTQAQTLIGQAREELSGRKYSSAIVLLRKAESLHESALDLRPLLEQAIQGQERERRERELHRVAEEIRKLLSSAEWDEAESKLRSALGRYPGESLLVDLERQFSDQRRVEAAQRAVQRAELLVKAGNWGDAKAAVEEALVLDRSNPDAIELQGRVAQALSDQARRTNAQAILAQAHRALEQGEWTDAFSLLKNAESLDPGIPDLSALYRRAEEGQLRERQQSELKGLIEEIRRAIDGKDFDRAEQGLTSAEKRFAGDQRLSDLSQLLSREKVCEEARGLLQQADISFHGGRWEDAQRLAQEALSLDSTNAGARQLLVRVSRLRAEQAKVAQQMATLLEQARQELASGKFNNAIASLKKADSLNAADPDLRKLRKLAEEGRDREKLEREVRALGEEIRKLISSGNLERSATQLAAALRRFPGDPGLLDLEQILSEQRKNRASDDRNASRAKVSRREKAPKGIEPIQKPLLTQLEFPSASARTRIETESEDGLHQSPIRSALDDPREDLGVPAAMLPQSAHLATPTNPNIAPPAALRLMSRLRKSALIWASIGAVALTCILVFLRHRDAASAPASSPVDISVASTPAGASVHVEGNGLVRDCVTPQCVFSLPAGSYALTANLTGYLPAAQKLIALPGMGRVEVALTPRPLSSSSAVVAALVVQTPGVENATVFVDGAPYATSGSELRLTGSLNKSYRIRAEKNGFDPTPDQTITLSHPTESIAIHMRQSANAATLVLRNAPPRADILIDGKDAGMIGADGLFEATVTPGAHTVQLTSGRSSSAPISRQFNPHERVEIATLALQPVDTSAQDWEVVKSTNDGNQLNGFLQKHSSGMYADMARARLEDLDWSQSSAGSDRSRIQAYLQRHPTGGHSAQARGLLEQLDWDAVKNSNDESRLQAFENAYPQGRYTSSAVAAVQSIRERNAAEAKRKQEQDAAEAAKRTQETENARRLQETDLAKKNQDSTELAKNRQADDERGVREVIAGYQQAYENRSIDRLRQVWPSMSAQEVSATQQSFKTASAIHMTLVPKSTKIDGETAHVECTQTIEIAAGGAKQSVSNSASFSMQKRVGVWVIERVVYGKAR